MKTQAEWTSQTSAGPPPASRVHQGHARRAHGADAAVAAAHLQSHLGRPNPVSRLVGERGLGTRELCGVWGRSEGSDRPKGGVQVFGFGG